MKDDQQHHEIPFTEEIRAALFGQHAAVQAAIRALVMTHPDPVAYYVQFAAERIETHAPLLNLPCPDVAIDSFLDAAKGLDVVLQRPVTPDDLEA